MSGIAKNMKNMEAAGFGGCDGELENIKVTSASENKNKNMDEVRVAKPEVANPEEELDEWELEDDEEEQGAPTYVDDDEEEQNVREQLAEIEAARKAALTKRRESNAKQDAARAKQLRDNKTRAARKPTLGLGPYTWLDALVRGKDADIAADETYQSYGVAMQKGLMALVGKSREAISYRESRTFEKIAAIGYDGGGEGDETEGNIIKSQEKKLADRLSQIWKTMTTEAKEWAASVRGEKKMKAAASPSAGQTTSEQKPVSPVQAGQTESAPNDSMFQNILGMLARPPRDPRPAQQPVQQPVQQPNERDAGFDRMAKAKADAETDPRKLVCTRPCNEFKTGKPCPHREGGKHCNWGHSLDRFRPKKCAWPTTCNTWMKRQGACECAHVVNGVVETPRAVMERLLACRSLVKPMPETEPVMKKPTSQTVAAVQPQMSVDEKRAATHKHREQLKQMSGGGGGGVYQQRRAFVENPPDVGKPPSENPWSKPVKHVEPTTVSQSKPVLRCTPAMAAEMLLELKKAGIAADTVVLEIIGSN